MLPGIDTSNNQGKIDWSAVKRSGIVFAGLKTSGGRGFKDPTFNDNLKGCQDNGILPIPYHFEDDNNLGTGQQEAENMLEVMDKVGGFIGCLPGCLDFETGIGGREHEFAMDFLATIQPHMMNQRSILYGAPYDTQDWLRDDPLFLQYHLWVAHVGPNGSPRTNPPMIPLPWKQWWLWQYSWTGRVQGISGDVDMDWFDGTEEQLRSFIVGTTPQEEVMTVVQPGETIPLVFKDGLKALILGGDAASTIRLAFGTNGKVDYISSHDHEDVPRVQRVTHAVKSGTVWGSLRVYRKDEVLSDGTKAANGGPVAITEVY